MECVVVDEFGEGKLHSPVVLLVIGVDAQVLLETLVDTLGLTVGLWVVSG